MPFCRCSLALVTALFLLGSCSPHPRAPTFHLPKLMLWAWERSEDLRFINPDDAGVAFLAAVADVAPNGSIFFRMRTQHLQLPPGVALLPVVRIESPRVHAPLDSSQLAAGLASVANQPGVQGVQIDYDARLSERASYRLLLEALPTHTSQPIGVTALVSWCAGDRWLDGEPVAEAVPMFFRLGVDARSSEVRSKICASSIGLSTDEPWPAYRSRGLARIYLFTPRPWTPEEYARALARLANWKPLENAE